MTRTQKRLAATAGLILLLTATVLWVDRPWAWFAYRHFHESRGPFILMTRLVDVLELIAGAILIAAFGLFLFSWRLGERGMIALRVALALFCAIGVKEIFKIAFGRTWPETWVANNPSLISHDVFGFSPFHGGAGWMSFPSGHETVVCAVAACLWAQIPSLRPLWLVGPLVVGPLVVGLGLLGADYHFVSDVLAGAALGWAVGLLMARLELTPKLRG